MFGLPERFPPSALCPFFLPCLPSRIFCPFLLSPCLASSPFVFLFLSLPFLSSVSSSFLSASSTSVLSFLLHFLRSLSHPLLFLLSLALFLFPFISSLASSPLTHFPLPSFSSSPLPFILYPLSFFSLFCLETSPSVLILSLYSLFLPLTFPLSSLNRPLFLILPPFSFAHCYSRFISLTKFTVPRFLSPHRLPVSPLFLPSLPFLSLHCIPSYAFFLSTGSVLSFSPLPPSSFLPLFPFYYFLSRVIQ